MNHKAAKGSKVTNSILGCDCRRLSILRRNG